MYLEHFSLNIKPFQITVDPKFLWLGEKHKEALATLRYGILDNRGFLLLTGEVGTGKTILINRLISLLDMDTVVATLPDPDLESMDFYNLLADGLKMNRTFESKGEFLIKLRDFLHQSHANQQQVLLVIDESQRLNHRLMEDIRVLSNIELQDRKLINIFFVGQQEFNSILLTPQNRALSQRITVRYHIEALDENETGAYIDHRLKVAGSDKKIFDKQAIREVYQVSGGIPRLINIVSDHALLTAYAKGAKQIDANIINECAEELRIPVKKAVADAASVKSGPQSSDANNADKESGAQVPINEAATIADNIDNETSSPPEQQQKTSSFWKLFYVVVIVLLIGGIAYLIDRYDQGPDQPYNVDDLTPKKYKSTLEMEKARLEDSLNNPDEKPESLPSTEDLAIKKQDADLTLKPIVPKVKDTDPTGKKPLPVVADKEKPVLKEVPPPPMRSGKVFIPFDINSNDIDAESYSLLNETAEYMVSRPELVAHVKGYTDNTGSAGYNESVSHFRASTVRSYLIAKGVNPENVIVFAMGGANPVASNTTREGRNKNRRVEIEIQQPNKTSN